MFHPLIKNKREIKIDARNQFASVELAKVLVSYLQKIKRRPIVILCIGTDRSTGDALGPLVGSFLNEWALSEEIVVFGTLEEPVHAVNLEEQLKTIRELFPGHFILAIDACLGRSNHVGMIHFKEGPVKPGAGVNKSLSPVGDAHITGVVNIAGFMEFFVLQNTRLHLVMKLAKTIADGIYKAVIFSDMESNNGQKVFETDAK